MKKFLLLFALFFQTSTPAMADFALTTKVNKLYEEYNKCLVATRKPHYCLEDFQNYLPLAAKLIKLDTAASKTEVVRLQSSLKFLAAAGDRLAEIALETNKSDAYLAAERIYNFLGLVNSSSRIKYSNKIETLSKNFNVSLSVDELTDKVLERGSIEFDNYKRLGLLFEPEAEVPDTLKQRRGDVLAALVDWNMSFHASTKKDFMSFDVSRYFQNLMNIKQILKTDYFQTFLQKSKQAEFYTETKNFADLILKRTTGNISSIEAIFFNNKQNEIKIQEEQGGIVEKIESFEESRKEYLAVTQFINRLRPLADLYDILIAIDQFETYDNETLGDILLLLEFYKEISLENYLSALNLIEDVDTLRLNQGYLAQDDLLEVLKTSFQDYYGTQLGFNLSYIEQDYEDLKLYEGSFLESELIRILERDISLYINKNSRNLEDVFRLIDLFYKDETDERILQDIKLEDAKALIFDYATLAIEKDTLYEQIDQKYTDDNQKYLDQIIKFVSAAFPDFLSLERAIASEYLVSIGLERILTQKEERLAREKAEREAAAEEERLAQKAAAEEERMALLKEVEPLKQKCSGYITLKSLCWGQSSDEHKKLLKSKDYSCSEETNILGLTQKLCRAGKMKVEFQNNRLIFNCSNFNTCGFNIHETSKKLIDKKIVPSMDYSGETLTDGVNYWTEEKYCGRGPKGDLLCVKEVFGVINITLAIGASQQEAPTFD